MLEDFLNKKLYIEINQNNAYLTPTLDDIINLKTLLGKTITQLYLCNRNKTIWITVNSVGANYICYSSIQYSPERALNNAVNITAEEFLNGLRNITIDEESILSLL